VRHTHDDATGIICNHALRRERPVNLVQRGSDGVWQFLCGENDGHDSHQDGSVICAGCAFDNFVQGLSAEDVPLGNLAERSSVHARWVVMPVGEEVSEEED
jgi:hypothetical protein